MRAKIGAYVDADRFRLFASLDYMACKECDKMAHKKSPPGVGEGSIDYLFEFRLAMISHAILREFSLIQLDSSDALSGTR